MNGSRTSQPPRLTPRMGCLPYSKGWSRGGVWGLHWTALEIWTIALSSNLGGGPFLFPAALLLFPLPSPPPCAPPRCPPKNDEDDPLVPLWSHGLLTSSAI